MNRLESLITERKKELQELEDARGTRFPMIEEATDIQIAYITKELSDLEMLQEHEKHQLNKNQQIVLECLKEEGYAKHYIEDVLRDLNNDSRILPNGVYKAYVMSLLLIMETIICTEWQTFITAVLTQDKQKPCLYMRKIYKSLYIGAMTNGIYLIGIISLWIPRVSR